MSIHGEVRKITTHTLSEMKRSGEPIAMLTAYDFSMARIIDSAGMDVILVGDSASNVMAGHETTLPITLDQMIYHQTTGEFAYWYAETEKLVRCRLLSLTTTYPVDIPYYRE